MKKLCDIDDPEVESFLSSFKAAEPIKKSPAEASAEVLLSLPPPDKESKPQLTRITCGNQWSYFFAYGNLKRMGTSHELVAMSDFIGGGQTVDSFTMTGAHIPMLFTQEVAPVLGEVYMVSDATLKAIDDFAGVPFLFTRQRVDVISNGFIYQCWAHIVRGKPVGSPVHLDNGLYNW